MISRNLRIALAISISIHIFFMSAFLIVPPKNLGRNKAYSKVEFLGPILEKTAFDIMLESSSGATKTSYNLGQKVFDAESLKVKFPGKRDVSRKMMPEVNKDMDVIAAKSIRGNKSIPEFLLEVVGKSALFKKEVLSERKIINNLPPLAVAKDEYGDKLQFSILMKVLVNSDGAVVRAEPVTTSGYPQLDFMAAKYVKGWIFEPKAVSGGEGEWITKEIVIKVQE